MSAFLMIELKLREGAVGSVVIRRSLDEPRIAVRTHLAGELAGNRATRPMNQPLGEHRGWRQVVAASCGRIRDCGDAWPIAPLRFDGTELGWQRRAAAEHDHVARRMV